MNYFSEKELACQHCGEYKFDAEFLELLNHIRADCGFPLPVSSGYRCTRHPIEAAKRHPGAHSSGRAVDIAVSGNLAHKLVSVATAHGVPRIGVNQKGDIRFIHLDWDVTLPGPTIWSY
jgi:zinc D-Ala-D-Ala carboxypeptidase